MTEYIEREFNPCDVCDYKRCSNCVLHELAMKIVGHTAADIALVKHGRWYDVNLYEHGEKAIATCSHCRVRGAVRTKRTEWGFWVIDSPMCPNCGARMDGE